MKMVNHQQPITNNKTPLSARSVGRWTLDVGRSERGQSMIELLIGIALGILLVGGAIGVIVLTLRIGTQNKYSQTSAELAHEYADQVITFADSDWHNLYDVSPHGSSTAYHLQIAGNFFTIASGTEQLTLNDITHTRYFTIEDVERDSNATIVSSGGTTDPSTLKLTIYSEWNQANTTGTVSIVNYLSRHKSRVFSQTDWAGGSGQEGPITSPNTLFSTSTNINYASTAGSFYIQNLSGSQSTSSTNIDSTLRYAWNDLIGWVDFYVTDTVVVSSTFLQGYGSSSVNQFALDCATSPTPDCDPDYGVDNSNGILSGWAWNDTIGWVSFASSSASSTYGVTINQTTGDFSGWAWNDVVGWFSFSCENTGSCGTVTYKTKTGWNTVPTSSTLISSILDTQVASGAAFNTLMWQGSLPAGATVKFQLATSDSTSGPWNYYGPDGTTATYYQPTGPDAQIAILRSAHNNDRYIRYKAVLETNSDKTQTPRVDDIIIGWSP